MLYFVKIPWNLKKILADTIDNNLEEEEKI